MAPVHLRSRCMAGTEVAAFWGGPAPGPAGTASDPPIRRRRGSGHQTASAPCRTPGKSTRHGGEINSARRFYGSAFRKNNSALRFCRAALRKDDPALTLCCRNLKAWQQPTVRPRPPVARRGSRRVWRTRPCGTQERTCRRCAARGFRFFANFAPAFKSSTPLEGTAGRTQERDPATRPATTVDNGVGTASEGFSQSCTPSTSIFMSV